MRVTTVVAKVTVALVSLLVFGITWYSWTQLHPLTSGMATADVIDPAAQSPVDEQNILVVGLDTRTDAQGNPLPADVLTQLHAGSANDGGDSTDTIIVIHLPAGRSGQAKAISIPRDSYVQLAGGFGQHKINSAFARGKLAAQQQLREYGVTGAALETESDRAGAKATIQTVEQLTGLTINHYAAVNLAGFSLISQAVGGVPVCLKAPVHDSYSGAEFPAGPQLVSGPQALAFVRQRHGLPHGDLDRIQRQQAFLASIARVVLSGETLTDSTKRTDLIAAVRKMTVLDKGWDIVSLARQVQSMSAGDIHFVTIPVVSISLHTPHDGDAVEVDSQQVQAFVQEQIDNTRYPDAMAPEIPAPAAFALHGPPAPQTPAPADPQGPGTGRCVN